MSETGEISTRSNSFINNSDDPGYLFNFLNKYVTVQLSKSTSFCGFVHSIDPVSKSVILSIPKGEVFQTTLIPGHAVEDIFESSPPVNISFLKQIHKQNEEEISDRKAQIMAWFKSNLLPVSEDGENIAVGSVAVLPPYTVTDIYAENPIVALQIRNIMDKMPKDFKPKTY